MTLRTITVILLLWLPSGVMAGIPAPVRFENLGITEGLSQSSVVSILQDRLGFMWFCTEDGVNRYDGYHFTIFRNESGNEHSIPNSQMLAVHEDHYGHLWFVSTNGVSRFNRDQDNFERVLYRPAIISGLQQIRVVEHGDESFFLDDNIIYRINDRTGKLKQERVPSGIKARHFLACLPGNKLLVTAKTGLYTYDPVKHHFTASSLATRLGFIPRTCIQLSGHKQIFLDEHSIVFTDDRGQAYKRLALEAISLSGRAKMDGNGNLWVSTGLGVLCLDTTTMEYRVFSHSRGDMNSLAGNLVRSMYLDRKGILWLGTNEGGVSRLAPHKLKFSGMGPAHDDVSGITANAVLGFGEDAQHKIWMATDAGCVNIYDPGDQRIEKLDKSNGCPFRTDNYLLSILVDADYAWCGHDNGIDIISVKTHKMTGSPLVREDAVIKRIYKDAGGGIWAGGSTGIYRYNEVTRTFDPYPLPVTITSVDDLFSDNKGNLWIGCFTGLLRYHAASNTLVNYALKYPELLGHTSIIGGFSMDAQGSLWLGTGERGILRYDETGDSFIVWSTRSGLPNNVVYATMADNRNNIWVTTNAGVSRFDPATRQFTNFTVKDGLQSNEFIGRALFKDHAGRLYFGNIAGFNSILPEQLNINSDPPQPQITAFRIFDREQPFRKILAEKGYLELRTQSYFSIEYAALDFTTPSENKYKVMLEGFDEGWRPVSTAHSVSYTNLDPGHYTFRVIAYNNDDVPSARVLELPIYVKPPFYRTWWFITLFLCAVAALITYAVRRRVQDIRRKSAARLQLSDLNRQMTEYKLQALQAQMNPHFIFNSLNAIQSIIMQKDALRAAAYLADFSKLMRRILDNSHEQFVSLELITDTLKMYVHLEALRFNHEFTYEFAVDEEGLPMRELKLPPMLLQPYVENAILHGLMPKEGSKQLLVQLYEEGGSLHCIIEDNGVGRGNLKPGSGHISRGETMTRGIRDSLNNLLGIMATISYSDLKDSAGAATGTRVEIIIPIPEQLQA